MAHSRFDPYSLLYFSTLALVSTFPSTICSCYHLGQPFLLSPIRLIRTYQNPVSLVSAFIPTPPSVHLSIAHPPITYLRILLTHFHPHLVVDCPSPTLIFDLAILYNPLPHNCLLPSSSSASSLQTCSDLLSCSLLPFAQPLHPQPTSSSLYLQLKLGLGFGSTCMTRLKNMWAGLSIFYTRVGLG